jgi:hypothetical protein
MKKWFNRRGIINLVEMTWWQESSIPSHPEYTVVATPAMVPPHSNPPSILTKVALVSPSPLPHKHHPLDKFPRHPPSKPLLPTPPLTLPCGGHRLRPHPLRLHLSPLRPRLRTRSPPHRLVLPPLASEATTLRPARRGENARRVGRKEDGGGTLCDVDSE